MVAGVSSTAALCLLLLSSVLLRLHHHFLLKIICFSVFMTIFLLFVAVCTHHLLFWASTKYMQHTSFRRYSALKMYCYMICEQVRRNVQKSSYYAYFCYYFLQYHFHYRWIEDVDFFSSYTRNFISIKIVRKFRMQCKRKRVNFFDIRIFMSAIKIK